MQKFLRMAGAALALGSASSMAQHQHFENFNWRERESDHFTLRASSTNHDPARRYAEKVWDECVLVMPGLEADFANNEFRTPGGAKGADEAPYRFTVYLVGTGDQYRQILEQEKKRSGWDDNRIRACMVTRSYNDPQHRYRVLCKADPENTGGGGETDLTPSFVHGTAAAILQGRSRSRNLPFWMTAGWGYYVEHRIFRLCRVYYVDFEAYYGNQNAEIRRGGALGHEKSWTDPLQDLCKDGVRESLEKVCKADILTLTPNESGYIFALTYFLVSTDERVEKYRALVEKARGGGSITKDLLLKTYGYEDEATFEADWYEFVESSKFK